jgi:hypothetical protein
MQDRRALEIQIPPTGSCSAGLCAHLFLLGKDYHLGDLLSFTAVLATYRRQIGPEYLIVGYPDPLLGRILEHNPLIDELLYGTAHDVMATVRARFEDAVVLHDLRILPVAAAMLRAWRRRLPWLYYRDLWLDRRGQWLATFLQLGRLQDVRPVLGVVEDDRATASTLLRPYVVLAPHIGRYRLPVLGRFWRRVKGWGDAHWVALADGLRTQGYEPITLAAAGQAPIRGTRALTGLPMRQVVGVIEQAAALISVESGLWFVAAALGTPIIIVPWWLPRSINWVVPMGVPHRLIYRDQASVHRVLSQFRDLVAQTPPHEGLN